MNNSTFLRSSQLSGSSSVIRVSVANADSIIEEEKEGLENRLKETLLYNKEKKLAKRNDSDGSEDSDDQNVDEDQLLDR